MVAARSWPRDLRRGWPGTPAHTPGSSSPSCSGPGEWQGRGRSGVGMQDAGFGIRDSGFGIRDSGFGIRDSGFGIRDSGFGGGAGRRPGPSTGRLLALCGTRSAGLHLPPSRRHPMVGLFDILGPVMVGPSSSHTAGACRLGLMARAILGRTPERGADPAARLLRGDGRGARYAPGDRRGADRPPPGRPAAAQGVRGGGGLPG